MEHGARHLGAWRRTALDILEHGLRHLGAKNLGAWSMPYWQFRAILGSIFGAVCSAGTQLPYSKYWVMVHRHLAIRVLKLALLRPEARMP